MKRGYITLIFNDPPCDNVPIEYFFELYEYDDEIAEYVDDLCWNCPFQKRCLEYGMRTKVHNTHIPGTGVFGGVYINMGKYSISINSHKSKERREESKQMVERVKRVLNSKK